MDQRISLITLGVADLPRARTFYERLGWHGQEVQETVFFQAGGMALVLWGEQKLAEDAGFDGVGVDGFRGCNIALNVRSTEEVDEVIAAARDAGATIRRGRRRPSTAATPRTSPTPTGTRGRSPQPRLHARGRRGADPPRLRRRLGARRRALESCLASALTRLGALALDRPLRRARAACRSTL